MKYLTAILTLTFCVFCPSRNNLSTGLPKHKQVSECLSDRELDEIRRYAEHSQFEELKGHLLELKVHPEKPNLTVRGAIKHAAEIDEKRHLPYAALFVLRTYREQKKRHHHGYFLDSPSLARYKDRYDLGHEFIRLAKLKTTEAGYVTTYDCYNWVKKNKSLFIGYPLVTQELGKINQLQDEIERQWHEAAAETSPAQAEDFKKLKEFTMEAPVTQWGRAPKPVPEQINRILRRLREETRTYHLPYLLEYGLNLYLKNLTLSKLARVLPVEENLMLSELIRLTKIPKYKTAHEAGWLNRQFDGRFEDPNYRPHDETGYSSYQIYIWYLENWSSVLDMPNTERLFEIQEQIEKTGMYGVGGGLPCHYGCR